MKSVVPAAELFFSHHSLVGLDLLLALMSVHAGELAVILKSSINATKILKSVPNARSWSRSLASAARRPSKISLAGSLKSAVDYPAARNSSVASIPVRSPAIAPANAKMQHHLALSPAAVRRQFANTAARTLATPHTRAKNSSPAKPRHSSPASASTRNSPSNASPRRHLPATLVESSIVTMNV